VSTSTRSTSELRAPSGTNHTSASTSSASPSKTASTEPSLALRTQPPTPRRFASSRVESRKKHPLDLPVRLHVPAESRHGGTVARWRRSRSSTPTSRTLDVDAIANAANTDLAHGGGRGRGDLPSGGTGGPAGI
jgi:hypothetical protein